MCRPFAQSLTQKRQSDLDILDVFLPVVGNDSWKLLRTYNVPGIKLGAFSSICDITKHFYHKLLAILILQMKELRLRDVKKPPFVVRIK